ncbi:MAG: hypothetical protein AVDCRST_MAG43-409, partial [uncultured Thermomicrobiales bacterium]
AFGAADGERIPHRKSVWAGWNGICGEYERPGAMVALLACRPGQV